MTNKLYYTIIPEEINFQIFQIIKSIQYLIELNENFLFVLKLLINEYISTLKKIDSSRYNIYVCIYLSCEKNIVITFATSLKYLNNKLINFVHENHKPYSQNYISSKILKNACNKLEYNSEEDKAMFSLEI